MTVDPAIRVGDVVHDLVERGKMQVIEKAADSVKEYRTQEDFDLKGYKSHPLLGVSDEDTVWVCVYLPENTTTSFSGSYAFPESRLSRVPIEEADGEFDRIQHAHTRAFLTALFRAANDSGQVETLAKLTGDAGIPGPLVKEARELVEASTITAADSEVDT